MYISQVVNIALYVIFPVPVTHWPSLRTFCPHLLFSQYLSPFASHPNLPHRIMALPNTTTHGSLPSHSLPLDLHTAILSSPVTLATNPIIFVAIDTTTISRYGEGPWGPVGDPYTTLTSTRTLIEAVDTTTISRYGKGPWGPVGKPYTTVTTVVTSPLLTVKVSETST